MEIKELIIVNRILETAKERTQNIELVLNNSNWVHNSTQREKETS